LLYSRVMAKMVSVAGIVCFVRDLDRSVEFYKGLGFIFKEQTSDYAKAYLNWFWIELVPFDKAEESLFKKVNEAEDAEKKGAGLFLHVSVDDVDEFYQGLLDKGFKPSSKPKDFRWGRREFVIRDPDGYKLVFFQKI
jgi:catechol 2,3-dioxygenase-like lactoylglutathione lyase family enzyme